MKDKERISVSVYPSQLDMLDKEQDRNKISTRSKMIRVIFSEYFNIHQPEEGTENLVIKIPVGLLDQMRQLIDRENDKGRRSPLFLGEEEVILYALRFLLMEHSPLRKH
ncbi:MAG: hypothetical protein QGH39_10990 [Candidatus Thermoplasmatota archaeon]|jgi:hypothetical protein|nr:hypothetical protein [Candidatus Thermoplasmatota archaeon]MDP7266070.1 hypothetical protein [Candidatus Thermoplasmatota archaeon]